MGAEVFPGHLDFVLEISDMCAADFFHYEISTKFMFFYSFFAVFLKKFSTQIWEYIGGSHAKEVRAVESVCGNFFPVPFSPKCG